MLDLDEFDHLFSKSPIQLKKKGKESKASAKSVQVGFRCCDFNHFINMYEQSTFSLQTTMPMVWLWNMYMWIQMVGK